MPLEVLRVDHIYLTVSDFARSEEFYDAVMERLGFKKGNRPVRGEPHAHYYNRAIQLSIRPAWRKLVEHDPYAPGLHHVCFQLTDSGAVDEAAAALRELGVPATEPALYPDYAPDYYATFFSDPDGIRLELVAQLALRREQIDRWDELEGFLDPLDRLRERDRGG